MTTQEQRTEQRRVLIANFTTLCQLQLEEYREVTNTLINEMQAAEAAEAAEPEAKPARKPRKVKESA